MRSIVRKLACDTLIYLRKLACDTLIVFRGNAARGVPIVGRNGSEHWTPCYNDVDVSMTYHFGGYRSGPSIAPLEQCLLPV